MAVAFVAEVDGASVFNNPAVSASRSYAVGNLIVAIAEWDAVSTFTSIASDNGDVWTLIGAEDAGSAFNVKARAYWAISKSAAAQSITFTVSGTPSFCELYVWELSGADPVNPISAFKFSAATDEGETANFTDTISIPTPDNLVVGEIDGSTGTPSINASTTAATTDSGQGSNYGGHFAVWASSGTFSITIADTNFPTATHLHTMWVAVQPPQPIVAGKPWIE